jgi:hypothetical protein
MQFSYFSPELTSIGIIFEVLVGLLLVWVISYGCTHYKYFLWRFFALAFGVFCFEWLTGSMWNIEHLWNYAYIHNDISWVMTLAWSSIIFSIKFLYDGFIKDKNLLKEFSFVVIVWSIISGLIVIILKDSWIFGYSKTMQEILIMTPMILGRPLESILYIPTFIFTVYSFYKYWELAMYDKKLFSNYTVHPGKDIAIASVVIFLIGYLMHPLFEMTFNWTLLMIAWYIVWLMLVNYIINSIKDYPLFQRNMWGVFLLTLWGMWLLSYMIWLWLVKISESVTDTYTTRTVQIPWLNITDVEFVGIVLFSCLLIAIIKYFKIVTTQKISSLDDNKMTFRWFNSLIKK